MLADIYLGTALAIFLAIFGWSETIFGLSQRTKEKEAEFMRRAELTPSKYLELRKLVSTNNVTNQGEYTKSLMRILKDTKIKSGDSNILNKLGQNEQLFLPKLENYSFFKKLIACLLFLYLYTAGTIMLIMENSSVTNNLVSLNPEIIVLQSVLLIFVIAGGFVYIKTNKYERNIQLNLNSLIIQINGGK
ncbi:MAG: hypothetical protein AABX11_04795 [Nanoarchaeota archaeon]